jgi:hypothetical protein
MSRFEIQGIVTMLFITLFLFIAGSFLYGKSYLMNIIGTFCIIGGFLCLIVFFYMLLSGDESG